MLEALLDPGSMTEAQWKIVGILVIVIIGILFFVWRTYRIIKDSSKEKYKPNIGLSRTKKPLSGSRPGSENEDDIVH